MCMQACARTITCTLYGHTGCKAISIVTNMHCSGLPAVFQCRDYYRDYGYGGYGGYDSRSGGYGGYGGYDSRGSYDRRWVLSSRSAAAAAAGAQQVAAGSHVWWCQALYSKGAAARRVGDGFLFPCMRVVKQPSLLSVTCYIIRT